MTSKSADDSRVEPRPDIDAAGIDREQIRAFLRLTPEERLRRVEEHAESILEIVEINAAGGVR